MSIARITTVQRSMKPGECDKCGTALPKGSAYRWWKVGFRSRHRYIRCMAAECTPRTSELESSRYADVYAAIEDAQASIALSDDKDDVEQEVQSVADAMNELAEEYQTASEDENGTVFNQTAAERAEELESQSGELDGWTYDEELEGCDEHDELQDEGCDACEEKRGEYVDGLREAATDKLSEVSL